MRKLVALFLVAIVLLAACGSSKKNSGPARTNNSGNEPNGSATTGAGNGEFSALLANASKASVKITYKDHDGKSVTIAQDGNGKSLYESNGSLLITTKDATISCDGTDASAKCVQLSTGGAYSGIGASFLTSFLAIYRGLAHLDSSIYGGHTSSDNIAGRDAKCVTFKASDYAGLSAISGDKDYDQNAQATVCVDSETGFLLKLANSSSGAEKDELVATAVSTPSDADFNPPSTPETIPQAGQITLPGGGTVPNITLPGQSS
jgi:hypothetical protein